MPIIATREQVLAKVNQIAQNIYQNEPKDALFISLLNGAVPFTADLMRALQQIDDTSYPVVRYMHVSTYGEGFEARTPHIIHDTLTESDITAERTIIILDDVLDTGKTFDYVRKHLIERGAAPAHIKFAVLAQKDVPRPESITADYVGFYFNNAWLYGGGLNGIPGEQNSEAARWLGDIYSA